MDAERPSIGAEPLAKALLEAMSEAVYVVDRRRRITYWNPAAERITGFRAEDVVGKRCRDAVLNHVDEEGNLLCKSRCPLLKTMKDGQPREAYVFLHHKDGHRVPVAVCAAVLTDDGGQVCGAVEVFHDDSRAQSLTEQLTEAERRSLSDPLTGLGNRRLLDRVLERHHHDYRRYDTQFAVLFLDIDHFKNVNDTYGHDVGDRVLEVVSATLRDCVRPGDTVGRWGGEEFLVLAPVSEAADAFALAERIRNMVASAWVDNEDGPVSVTVSVGVAVAQGKESIADQVDRADSAMLSAKTLGRNRTEVG